MMEASMRRIRLLAVLTALATLIPLTVVHEAARADVTEFGWPYPPTNMDPYLARDHGGCNYPTITPGPQKLKDFLSFWNGAPHQFTPTWHITRPCSGGSSNSYHHLGRALDFYVNYNEPRAQSIVDFMLGPDEYGNPHGRARRWGIVEIIWKDQIWSSANPYWRHCGTCGPHYDHIHFSFSNSGAHLQTSWHTTTDATRSVACPAGTVTVKYWNYPSGYGPLKHVRSITGPYGNYTSQAALRSSPWRTYTSLGPSTLTADSPVSALYGARTFYGSCSITL
jgi:hypothetical protein